MLLNNFKRYKPPPTTVYLLLLAGTALPGFTFGKGALGVFAAVAVRITRRIDSLKADPRSRFRT